VYYWYIDGLLLMMLILPKYWKAVVIFEDTLKGLLVWKYMSSAKTIEKVIGLLPIAQSIQEVMDSKA